MGPDVVLAADVARTETPQGTLVSGVEPLPALTAPGARRGLVGLPVGADGAIRALPPLSGGFAEAILEAVGQPVPAPPPGALIPLPRAPGAYPQVSYYQALDPAGMLPPGFFQGRPVLIGLALRASADPERGGPDLFRTPWTARGAGLTPGVELHAHILDALLARAWITPVPAALPPALALIAAAATAALARGRGAAAAALVTLGGAGFWTAAAALGLTASVWAPPAAPVLATLLAGAGQAGLDFARERAARRRVTRAFEHYLAPAMVERLARDPSALRLGGELRRVSLLFSDLRGFTTLAEAMKEDPEGLTRLVNRALSPIVQAIHAQEGAVDKFIGDCVMGIWNAPADTPDHAARAVAGGIAAVRAVTRLSAQVDAEAEAEGRPKPGLAVGVGVNSGLCVVGNMGTEGRFDYTALGDAVNLAARLEGLTRTYGVDVVVGEDAVAEIGAEGAAALGGFAEIDRIAVKGRAGATRIFTPLALWDAGPPAAALQAEALAAYRAREWAGARAAWARLAAARPRAAPYAAVMADRAAAFAAEPPPEDWTGVWTATAK
jgi:adenylate cyclase